MLLTECKNDVLFLGRLYDIAEDAEKIMHEHGLIKIMQTAPELTGNESTAEKMQAYRDQSVKNIMQAAKMLMRDNPEIAIKLFRKFVVLEDGEEYPSGLALVNCAMKCITNNDILDFFLSVANLNQKFAAITSRK